MMSAAGFVARQFNAARPTGRPGAPTPGTAIYCAWPRARTIGYPVGGVWVCINEPANRLKNLLCGSGAACLGTSGILGARGRHVQCQWQAKRIGVGEVATQYQWCVRRSPGILVSNRSVSTFEPVSAPEREFRRENVWLGQRRVGIFDDTSRFHAAETALSRVFGGTATESQRLFRRRQET
jgi:hypothetical protein